jgi:hypothetical protein
MQVDSGAAAGAGMMVHGGEAGLAGSGGGDRAVDFGSDNPMENMSLAEFTREMKLDADRQQGLVPIVAKLLLKLVEFNDKMPLDKDHITVFHAQKAPAVSVMDYSERIAKYSSCSYCCFVVGVIYMDRFIQQQRVMQKVCVCTHTHTQRERERERERERRTHTHTHTHTDTYLKTATGPKLAVLLHLLKRTQSIPEDSNGPKASSLVTPGEATPRAAPEY